MMGVTKVREQRDSANQCFDYCFFFGAKLIQFFQFNLAARDLLEVKRWKLKMTNVFKIQFKTDRKWQIVAAIVQNHVNITPAFEV